jgi:AcrR family transcriptional regulator
VVDARILNTAAALNAAVVSLASATPISQLTVADVTRAAEINRATFYSHYTSPSALLAHVLSTDLETIRAADNAERTTASREPAQITRQSVLDSVRHVNHFRDIYRLALTDASDGTTHHVLAAQFYGSCLTHLRDSVSPERIPGDIELVAAYVANGLVGTIEAAVASDHWDENQLADLLMAMLPPWWDAS